MSASANILLHLIQTILEDLGVVTGPDDEASQLINLLPCLLLPGLKLVDLPSVRIKATVDLLKVPFHHVSSLLDRGNQFLDL